MRVLLNGMQDAVDAVTRFWTGRSCIDQIFTVRQIIEKVTEVQRPEVVNFFDFGKAGIIHLSLEVGLGLGFL